MLAPFFKVSARRQCPKTIKKTYSFFGFQLLRTFWMHISFLLILGANMKPKTFPKSRFWGLCWALWLHLWWLSATCGVTLRCDCQLPAQICQDTPNLVPTSPNLAQLGSNLAQLCSNLAPTCSQLGATWPQIGPKMTQLSPTWPQLAPTWPQLDPTWSQHGPNKAQLCPTRPNLAPNWFQNWST